MNAGALLLGLSCLLAATAAADVRDGCCDPSGRSVADDYDFAKLIDGCWGILAFGMKPEVRSVALQGDKPVEVDLEQKVNLVVFLEESVNLKA